MKILGFGDVALKLSKVSKVDEVIIIQDLNEIFLNSLNSPTEVILSDSLKHDLFKLNIRWLEDPTTCYDFDESVDFYFQNLLGFLVENKIEFIIYPSGIAHHLSTALLELAASYLKINSLYTYNSIYGLDRFLIYRPGPNFSTHIPVEVNGNIVANELKEMKAFQPPPSNQVLKWYYKSVFIAILRAGYTSINLIFFTKEVRINSIVAGKFSFFNHMKSLKNIRKYMHALKRSFAHDIKFLPNSIIFYGHFQPEASTYPEGGEYWNQIKALRNIRSNFQNSQIIYREHPGMEMLWGPKIGMTRVGYCRSLDYLNQLKDLQIDFISNNDFQKNFEALKSIIVVTITGTIAVQRSLNGYKTIVLGKPFYIGLPGTYSMEEFMKGYLKNPSEFLARDV